MSKLETLLIRHAIELIAVIGDHTETMLNLTKSFLESEFNIEPSVELIRQTLDKETASRLFFACAKSKPDEIKKPGSCIRIAKDLWLAHQIATTDYSFQEYRNIIKEKFAIEKEITTSGELGRNYLEKIIDDFENDNELFCNYKENIKNTIQYFQVAFYVMNEFFSKTNVKEIFEIYNPFGVSKKENVPSNNERDNEKKDAKVKYLEKTIHELKVKLEYSQKDSIREIVMALSSSGYGSPLLELNAIKNIESTPESIKSTISNLFLALESFDIRVSKEKIVGNSYKADEIEDGKFNLIGKDTISSDDIVKVKYPGIKLGREYIVKPTIVKEEQ